MRKIIFILVLASLWTSAVNAEVKITLTNLTKGTILTPPVFSTSHGNNNFFELGEVASIALAKLAEGGDTTDLAFVFSAASNEIATESTAMGVLPGHTIMVTLDGDRNSKVNVASMILPTNDGFIALQGASAKKGKKTFYLTAYDSGTEENSEHSDDIPGPLTGGDGYLVEGELFLGISEITGMPDFVVPGFIIPHAGLQGNGNIDVSKHNWGEPVAKVTIEVVNN